MKPVVGVLLAAGSASRFGSNKLVARLPDGRLLISAAAQPFIQALPKSIAVVRNVEDVAADVLAGLGFQIVVNPSAAAGMGSSLAAGVRAGPGAAGWVIGLADMPWLQTETIAGVAMRVRAGASICAPLCRGRRGHPVGFAAGWRDSLLALSGDQGARGLLTAHPEVFVPVPTLDAGALRDVDVVADLEP